MRILAWGMSGDDVKNLQKTLQARGYYNGPIDGWFGYLTDSAVRRYQMEKGLWVDGKAGPQTQQSLGLVGPSQPSTTKVTSPSPAPTGAAAGRAVSLHIGLNRVDPSGYGGWSGPLSGCEADADTMTAIAEVEGFSTNQLKTADATSGNVLDAIAQIADVLESGDIFFLTYAGHGSQIPNGNNDPELDSQDETWCLYDRQLLDDEIEAAFAEFGAGVNIVLLSDSCHSGTIYRLQRVDQMNSGALPLERSYALLKESFYLDLAAGRPGPREPAFTAFPVPLMRRQAIQAQARLRPGQWRGVEVGKSQGRPLTLDLGESGDATRSGNQTDSDDIQTRDMPFDVMVALWDEQGERYERRRQAVANRAEVKANGVSISGCMDNQLSQEVNGAGVFTTTVNSVWANNTFTASYDAFHKAVVAQMGPNQTPDRGTFGANPDQLLAMTPFNRR